MNEPGKRTSPEVFIIGAGLGGLGMALYLKRAGIESFTIFEKGDDVGGVWRENTYPGCGCDVPSHLYSYSFEKYRNPSRRYPKQSEILAYLQNVARKYGIHRHIRLNREVAEARYDEVTSRWTITTADGDRHAADVVVYAVGQLHRPNYPDIPGRDSFAGTAFHTARWKDDYDPTGRNVAIIGTGSSAAQLVPHVARQACRLHLFQRTAGWVLPKPSAEFHGITRAALTRFPFFHALYRAGIYAIADTTLAPVITRGWSAPIVERIARRHLAAQIDDPRLRKLLTPNHPIGCKRPVIDSNFYPALNASHVELVTEPIARITPRGIDSANGASREVDTIIYATGFRATEFLVPIRIFGKNATDLHEQWRHGAEAYLGMAVPNFPNLFIIQGPNTILGHNSNVFMIECQARYILQCLRMLEGQHGGLEVRCTAMAAYQAHLRRAIDRTVWTSCQSWYRTELGKVTNPWPGSSRLYRRLTRHPVPEAFQLVHRTCCTWLVLHHLLWTRRLVTDQSLMLFVMTLIWAHHRAHRVDRAPGRRGRSSEGGRRGAAAGAGAGPAVSASRLAHRAGHVGVAERAAERAGESFARSARAPFAPPTWSNALQVLIRAG